MRPITLTFSGLRSHQGTCGPLDFTGRNLVAILGDTGAGKTSVLEAILLALYGTCSWSGNEVSSLIAEGQQRMSVVFDFTADGTPFRVSRTYYRGTRPSKHCLENLDKGTVVTHTSRETDREIVRLLKLDLPAFKAAVLLPQGDFDRLLHASPTDRTTMLRGVFGIDELTRVRARARQHREALQSLVHQAELARAALLPDPRARAESAEQQASAARDKSVHLGQCLTDLEAGQEQAVAAQRTAEHLGRALADLAAYRVTDHVAVLDAASTAQQELDTREQALWQEKAAVQGQLTSSEQEIDRLADTDGLTPDRLASARAVMNDAVSRTGGLEREAVRIADEEQRLDAWSSRLEKLQQTRDGQRDHARQATGTADAAAERARGLSRALNGLGNAAAAALTSAQSAADARAAAARASDQHQQQSRALPALADIAAQAQDAHHDAELAHQALLRGDAAYAAGRGLGPGDDCPICERTLDSQYAPPQPGDHGIMTAAHQAVTATAAALAKAERAHENAVAETDRIRQERDRLDREADEAQEHLTGQLADLEKQTAALPAAGLPSADEATRAFTGQTSTALRQLASTASGDAAPPPLVDELMAPLNALEQLAQDHAANKRSVAQDTADEANATDIDYTAQSTALKEATAALTRDRARHTAQHRELLGSLAAVPVTIRVWDEGAMPDHDQLREALEHVEHHLQAVHEWERQCDTARRRLLELEQSGQLLRDERAVRVSAPLQKLTSRLERWRSALDDARRTAAEDIALPEPAGTGSPELLRQYAAGLARAATTLHQALTNEQQAARSRIDGFREMLASHAGAWPMAQHDTPFPVPLDGDLLAHRLLNPLRNQLSAARTAVQQAAEKQVTALSQIPHYDALTAAIEAGTAQVAAWKALGDHLSDSNFPTGLTHQRTRSLLAEGSRLLRELSGGEFAFTDDFRIAHVPTRTDRTSQTLSGGETFLASLALALALIELHSRSSARLEALFLDEGFGSLDAQTLDTALAVLRSHAKNKLIVVISHLRPVAEAVDDVLWIRKEPLGGSDAQWLTPANRDAVLREDIAGLLSPA